MSSLANSTFAAFVVDKYTHLQFKLFLHYSWSQVLGGCVYFYSPQCASYLMGAIVWKK